MYLDFTICIVHKSHTPMTKPPIGRPVKEVYRHVIRTEWFRQFKWWERLRILVGFNLLVYVRIPTRHNPAAFQPIIGGRTTRHNTADDHLIAELEIAVRDAGATQEIFTDNQSGGQSDGQSPG